jgi:hypothetical protein
VAKAALPNRMGRIDYRLSAHILTVNARAGIPFSVDGTLPSPRSIGCIALAGLMFLDQLIPEAIAFRIYLLGPADQCAARLAREDKSEPIQIEETDTTFAIGWKGRYRIEGPAFIYSDEDTGRVATILGYPTDKLTQAV